MNPQSDLRLGSTMLFVGALICGGFTVAALYPVVRNTTWRELLSRPVPTAVTSADTLLQRSASGQPLHAKTPEQAAGSPNQIHKQRLAQKRRVAEQELLRKQVEQQQSDRRAAHTRPAQHQRVAGRTNLTVSGPRSTQSVPRPMSGGTTRNPASSDAQRNEVYVPVNVHPVTVNVDGSAMSGEVARLADGIQQVLSAQREALRTQQQIQPVQVQPVLVQPVPHQVLHPAEPDASVRERERQQLEKIDSTLTELATAFESLRTETRSAVAGISQDVTHAQASQIEVTSQLLAEYRLAIEQQQQLMRRCEEDVTARIRMESLSAAAQTRLNAVEEPVAATQMPAEFYLSDSEVTQEPLPEEAFAPTLEPAEAELPPEQPIAAETSTEQRLLRIPEPSGLAETPDPAFEDDVVEERGSDFAEFEAFEMRESDHDHLDSRMTDRAEGAGEEKGVSTADPWDLENPVVESDAEPEFEAWVASHYKPRHLVRDPKEIARATEQQRARAVAYEQTYRFPLASSENPGQQVRHAVGYRENRQPQCRNPHHAHASVQRHASQPQMQSRSSVQPVSAAALKSQLPQSAPPQTQQRLAASRSDNVRPVPSPGRPSERQASKNQGGIFTELGHNVRHGASQLGVVLAGPNPRLKPSRKDSQDESRFFHRVKAAFRNVSGDSTVQ